MEETYKKTPMQEKALDWLRKDVETDLLKFQEIKKFNVYAQIGKTLLVQVITGDKNDDNNLNFTFRVHQIFRVRSRGKIERILYDTHRHTDEKVVRVKRGR